MCQSIWINGKECCTRKEILEQIPNAELDKENLDECLCTLDHSYFVKLAQMQNKNLHQGHSMWFYIGEQNISKDEEVQTWDFTKNDWTDWKIIK